MRKNIRPTLLGSLSSLRLKLTARKRNHDVVLSLIGAGAMAAEFGGPRGARSQTCAFFRLIFYSLHTQSQTPIGKPPPELSG
jgi:hypothetical protein